MHFTGKERDSESNLDNFGARYFSSQMGRFQSPDPLMGAGPDFVQATDPQGWNAYSYVRNNPLSNVDPDGLDCVYINDNSVSVLRGDCASDTDNGIFVNGTINTNSFTYNSQTQTLGFNYTNDDTGALGSGVIAGVAPSSPPTSTDYLNAVAQGTQMSRPIVEPAFWATMGFLGAFGPGILESSLALPGAGLTIPGGGLVIGKMGDLGNLGPGERTLDLPNQGNPQDNWAQDAGNLRFSGRLRLPASYKLHRRFCDVHSLTPLGTKTRLGQSLQSDGYWHPPGK